MDREEIRQAYQYALKEQELWWQRYNGCYQYAMPNRNIFYQMAEGQKKDYYLFDTTAVLAVRAFVAKTQASITPPGVNWCTLTAGRHYDKRSDKDDINKLLQIISNMMFDYLRRSNFDTTSAESYYDLAAGTAAIYVKETNDSNMPFWFESVGQYLIAAFENSQGMLTNVFRQYKFLRYYQIKKRFPFVNFPKDVEDRIKQAPYDLCPLVEGWIDYEDGTYCHVVGDSEMANVYYQQEGHESSPWIVFRWAKLPGENYGRGPLMDVIGDVKTCNKMMEKLIKQADLVVNPPTLALANSLYNPNNLLLQPGATMTINSPTGSVKDAVAPLNVSGNFELGEWAFNKWWQNINNAMFANPIGQMNDPTKTATEIAYRQQLYAEEVGPALGRLQQEFLNPLIRRLVFILKRMGKLPEEINLDDKWASISYQSPLLENQKDQELESIERYAQTIDQIAGPQAAMQTFNLPKAVRKIAEITNVDLDIVKTEGQIMQTLQDIGKAMQSAAQQGQVQGPNIPQAQSVLPAPPSQTNPGQ